MKRSVFALVFMWWSVAVSAQTQRANHIGTFSTLPHDCRVGDIAQKTGSSAGLYNCSATNTWTLLANAAGAGTIVGGTCSAGSTITAIDSSGNVTCTKGAWVQLAQTVTSGSQASVDFTSISGSYATLKLVYWAKDTTAGTGVSSVRLKINNDGTSGNYTTTGRSGTSNGANFASPDAAAATGGTIGNITNAGTTSEVGVGEVTIQSYATTAFFHLIQTTWANFSTGTNNQLGFSSFAYLATTAISRLTITGGTAFTDGSIFTLYGVP